MTRSIADKSSRFSMDLLTTLNETLQKALDQQNALADAISILQTENASLKTRIRSASNTVERLIFDNHSKQARIETLERQHLSLQTKCRKWKHRCLVSSPIKSSSMTLYTTNDAVSSLPPSSLSPQLLHGTPLSLSGKRQRLHEVSASQQYSKKRTHDNSVAEGLEASPTHCKDEQIAQHDLQPALRGFESSEECNKPHSRLQSLLKNPVLVESKFGPCSAGVSRTGACEYHERLPRPALPNPTPRRTSSSFNPASANRRADNICGITSSEGNQCQPSQKPLPCGATEKESTSREPQFAAPLVTYNKANSMASLTDIGNIEASRFSAPTWSSDRTAHKQSLPPTEVKDLLSIAGARRIQEMLDQSGQSNARAKSPPGFWQAGMPSTQEEKLHRMVVMSANTPKVRP